MGPPGHGGAWVLSSSLDPLNRRVSWRQCLLGSVSQPRSRFYWDMGGVLRELLCLGGFLDSNGNLIVEEFLT